MTLLEDGGCHPFCADKFMASMEGSISALERRILVPDEVADQARELLKALDDPPPQSDDGEDDD